MDQEEVEVVYEVEEAEEQVQEAVLHAAEVLVVVHCRHRHLLLLLLLRQIQPHPNLNANVLYPHQPLPTILWPMNCPTCRLHHQTIKQQKNNNHQHRSVLVEHCQIQHEMQLLVDQLKEEVYLNQVIEY